MLFLFAKSRISLRFQQWKMQFWLTNFLEYIYSEAFPWLHIGNILVAFVPFKEKHVKVLRVCSGSSGKDLNNWEKLVKYLENMSCHSATPLHYSIKIYRKEVSLKLERAKGPLAGMKGSRCCCYFLGAGIFQECQTSKAKRRMRDSWTTKESGGEILGKFLTYLFQFSGT